MGNKFKLIVMNFFEFAVWGAYLTSQGRYLSSIGLEGKIGIFYAVQGIVSIFMPALLGIIADKWIQPQKLLGLSHLIAGASMIAAGLYGNAVGEAAQFGTLFTLYTISVSFFMPTIALDNSVSYIILEKAHLDPVKEFPKVRIWGTIGFILSMWLVNLVKFNGEALQVGPMQYVVSGIFSIILTIYAFTLPKCPIVKTGEKKSLVDAMGLRAFALFKERKMAIFFIFSMLLGVALQITNGFVNPYLGDFGNLTQYAGSLGVKYSNILISISQISETLCILLIPFFMKRYGIKKVMLISMFAWLFRFGLLGLGNPEKGLWLFILSMIIYGVAFDFFNISGSLFVDDVVNVSMRSSAQGLFMLMTNGIGATVGTLGAQEIINWLVNSKKNLIVTGQMDWNGIMAGWSLSWYIFAAYALVIAILFMILFKYKYVPNEKKK